MGSGGSNPPLSARSKNAKTRTTSVSFFYGAPEKTNAFVFSSGAIKKAAPCCFAFLDLKPPPRGTPSASGAKVIPQGNPLICGYRGTPSAFGAKVIPRGKTIDLRLPGNTERLWREGNPPGEVVSTPLGKNTRNRRNTRKIRLCIGKHVLTTSPPKAGIRRNSGGGGKYLSRQKCT